MKKILITGERSYIGVAVEKRLMQFTERYKVDTISVRTPEWQDYPFSSYDTVLHVAAIVHTKERDLSKYFGVNRDLAVHVAQVARNSGVSQFIFLSTMGVYGVETGRITLDSKPSPKTPYATSKYEAEVALERMSDDHFRVAIIRPPIVYGPGCKGNYPRLSWLARTAKLFPRVSNRRSMIYIDNLAEFIRLVIDRRLSGLLFPQNAEYVNTTELVSRIAAAHQTNLRIVPGLTWVLKLGMALSADVRKVFGSFYYDLDLPGGPHWKEQDASFDYQLVDFDKSIRLAEQVIGERE